MSRSKKPNLNDEDLGISPFTSSLEIIVNKMAFRNQYKKENGGLVPLVVEVERQDYCKVYLSSDRRLCIMGLSLRAKEMMWFMAMEVPAGKDYLWVNKARYMREASVKALNTYKDAIRELCKNSIIALTPFPDVFWINPNFFFHGNRVNKYPDNIIEDEGPKKELVEEIIEDQI